MAQLNYSCPIIFKFSYSDGSILNILVKGKRVWLCTGKRSHHRLMYRKGTKSWQLNPLFWIICTNSAQVQFQMDSPDADGSAAVSPTSVELTSSPLEIKTPPQSGARVTFCTYVGWDGTVMLLFTSGVSGLFIWIYLLYTKSFQAFHRPWVWLFLVLALLYLLLTILYVLSWKKLANTYSVYRPAEPGKGKNSIFQKIVKARQNYF